MADKLDFMREAFMDDMVAIGLTEKKYGIKMADWYDAIREGRISNNDFQVMLTDYINLCRRFRMKGGD
ncbi:hypothetical protein ES708_27393 [subsurface metagenome]